jgi:hypothetical protein
MLSPQIKIERANRGQNCPTNQIRKTNHNMAENGKKDMQPVGLEPTPLS